MKQNIYIVIALKLTLALVILFGLQHRVLAEISLQGYTGLLNLPTAEITPTGTLDILVATSNEYPRKQAGIDHGRDVLFSIGLWSWLEIGGRHAARYDDQKSYRSFPENSVDYFLARDYNWGENRVTNDLSGNIKIRLPLPEKTGLPSVAFGQTDFAGLAKNFSSKYAVISKQWSTTEWTIGYRDSQDHKAGLAEGIFAGASWRPVAWLGLIAEHDGRQNSVGLRLQTPQQWLGWGQFGFVAAHSLGDQADDDVIGLSLRIPLGATELLDSATADLDTMTPKYSSEHVTASDKTLEQQLQQVTEVLEPLYLAHLSVGAIADTMLVLQYEDDQFDRNWLDGVGVVAGRIAQQSNLGFTWLKIRLLRNQIAIQDIRIRLGDFADYLNSASCATCRGFTTASIVHAEFPQSDWIDKVEWSVQRDNAPLPDIMFSPDTSYRVGTEVGSLDYSIALNSAYTQSLWQGGVLRLSADVPIAHSRNYSDGKIYAGYRHEASLHEAMLYQVFSPTSGLYNITAAGIGRSDFGLITNESLWYSATGTHRLRMNLGYYTPYREQDRGKYRMAYRSGEDGKVYLGEYRYLIAPIDTTIKVVAGQFLYQDRAVKLTLQRSFFDKSFALFIKKNEQEKAAGVTFTMPLTTRKSYVAEGIKVRGQADFALGLQTSILDDGSNKLRPNIAVEPTLGYSLENSYANFDRVGSQQFIKGLTRMRDAYWRYGAN